MVSCYHAVPGIPTFLRQRTANLERNSGVIHYGSSGPTTYDQVIEGGPFDGVHPADAIARSIEWWLSYLDQIDRRAADLRQKSD